MSLLGSIGSAVASLANTAWQNYENRKAVSKANSFNFGMWQNENEYNKPINQMARLEEAGLNPNLVYGSGATTLSAHSQGAHEAQQRAPDFLETMGRYQDIRQKDAQTENIKAQEQQLKKQGVLTTQQTVEAQARAQATVQRAIQDGYLFNEELKNVTMKNQQDAMKLKVQQALQPALVRMAKNKSSVYNDPFLGSILSSLQITSDAGNPLKGFSIGGF